MSSEVLHCNDSKSLWNYTLSPGWTEKEVEVFRLALMKFGMGKWTQIVKSRCLPGKTVAQLNNQMQRMIGQQSTGEFVSLHIDPKEVFKYNEDRPGTRKNGCLINTGDNPTREEVMKKRARNKAKWGLTKEAIDSIVIPTLDAKDTSTLAVKSASKDKHNLLQQKYDRVRLLERQIQKIVQAMKILQAGKENQHGKQQGKVRKKDAPIFNSSKRKEPVSKSLKAQKSRKQDNEMQQSSRRSKRGNRSLSDYEYALKLQQQFNEDAGVIEDGIVEEMQPERRNSKRRRQRNK